MTVSIGVASLPAVATTADELLAAADRGLYQAKRSGRDMVVVTQNAALDAWARAAPVHGQLLSLNVSPDVLVDGLPWTLRERLPPNTVLELSEHAPVRSYPQLNAALDEWRAAGFAIAVDDVGAGHASLRHVLELQPDLLKLDHFLVHDLPSHPPKRALVRSLTMFCREHGGRLVAEGVEDATTADVLIELGVELGQGWHFGRPGRLVTPARFAASTTPA